MLLTVLEGHVESEVENVMIASTSLSLWYHQNGRQLISSEYRESHPDQSSLIDKINSMNAIDTLEVYANATAERLFKEA